MEDDTSETLTLVMRLEGITVAEANRQANALRQTLLQANPTITVDIVKANPETQDFGVIVVAILSAKAVVSLAKGVANFGAKWASSITIETPEGKVVARGDAAKDAVAIVAALRAAKH